MKGFGNYDKYPSISVDRNAFEGFENLRKILKNTKDRVTIFDCYPIVDTKSLLDNIKDLYDIVILSDECAYKNQELTDKMQRWLTNDRIFGLMTTDFLDDYFIKEKIEDKRKIIENSDKKVLVIGVGALLVYSEGLVLHASIARWESQLRFRKGTPNWNCDNYNEDPLTKFKRGYFSEWRLGDKHKVRFVDKIDYFVDTNDISCPKVISRKDYFYAMQKTVKRPFRVVPYFDPGVWGGQWMKDVCGLDKREKNFAWCFDCVPEENSMYYDFGNVRVEMPAIDLVLFFAKNLLGERVQARFGNEFPIRFDFLDTMGGQNLSLQVHPTTEYIQQTFNMHYTQDESYYILDCEDDGSVFLGVKKDIDKNQFIQALQNAQNTGEINVEKYINRWHAKKHDHFLIPAGTIHCSGSNAMVLEISSTPYIFTFKLWDWGRLGLDGKPRPINIGHGSRVIDFSRDTDWVANNLVGQVNTINNADTFTEEKTGLHEREFLETRRHWFCDEVLHKSDRSVNVLNLVEGEEAEIISPDNSFEPFVVHYAETFILPADAGDYIIRPTKKTKGKKLATIKAYVRG